MRASFKDYLLGIRIQQWVKNILIFVPLIMAQQITDYDRLGNTLLAFLAFCFCASGVYLCNDIIDLENDRKHPLKNKRPLAAGKLSLSLALALAIVSILLSLSIGLFVGSSFVGILLLYLLFTLTYSFWLKRFPIIDIILLASLYTLRVFAGGIASDVPVSHWLLAFSMFIFLSLASIKRYSELLRIEASREDAIHGRGYLRGDQNIVAQLGSASGYIAVLVLALYVSSEEVKLLYKNFSLLWLLCPMILFWISRTWLFAARGEIKEDPLVYALSDRISLLVGFLCLLLIILQFKMALVQSWGLYPKVNQLAYSLEWTSEKVPFLEFKSVLPYGNGRSYGDCCLNEDSIVLNTRNLSRFVNFDSRTGFLTAEAGVTLQEIIDLVLPSGWFLPVTPGTQFVTLGGAIANDIHGKNHHQAGTFGNFVKSFSLLRSNGEILTCSADENKDLFQATIAGIGLTGLILEATIKLKPVKSTFVSQELIQFESLDEFLEISSDSHMYEYTVAWLDCTSKGRHFGRGIFIRGSHSEEPGKLEVSQSKNFSVPFFFPSFALNNLTIKAFNFLYYFKQRKKVQKLKGTYLPFFYPLDSINNWNRIYGRRGFLQFQCVIPKGKGWEGLKKIFSQVVASGKASFLTVIKEFGSVTSPGMLSFPRPGITLCLDFACSKESIKLVQELNSEVKKLGGAIYPAKDACMLSEEFKYFFPKWKEFGNYIDPKFSSSLWRRVVR